MIKKKIGVISDLHLFNKTASIKRALQALHDIELLLIIGDIADRAEEKQYDILLQLLSEQFNGLPVYCVTGNHDNPARDDTNYRLFERSVNDEYPSLVDGCGAFYKYVNKDIDLIGLNPVYHQKCFFFPGKGAQLLFLQEHLRNSSCRYHIVMCHPPLILHNPQRTPDMTPYIVAEQDKRFQEILDETGNVILISGHTHVSPTVEFDNANNNLYINDGSICPTVKKHGDGNQQGNVILVETGNNGFFITAKGIYDEEVLMEKFIEFS